MSLQALLKEWKSTGEHTTALLYVLYSAFSMALTILLALLRFSAGRTVSGCGYLVLFCATAMLFFLSRHRIRTEQFARIGQQARPVVVIGFLYGLCAMYFIDGGLKGAVPALFLLAFVSTPCFIEGKEAYVFLLLELLAYGTAIVLSLKFPDYVNAHPAADGDLYLPLFVIAVVLGVFCLAYTTAYRSQQIHLNTATEEANAANEAKNRFLDSMSHEIRTPMNSILGMNEMILREEERPEIREYALAIHRSGSALLSIINDVLDYSKIEDNRMEILSVRYDLSSLINDMVNMTAEQLKSKSLDFNVEVDPGIPRILRGDEYRIRQCLTNILSNAVKFTELGEVSLTVSFAKLDEFSINLSFSVTDTGAGIRPEDMDRIIKPFEHGIITNNLTSEGSGLGLTIVNELLHLMDSDLKIESTYRKGSTFSFTVRQDVMKWEPIGDYGKAYKEAISHQATYRESFRAPEANILVVDDTEVNLIVFRNLLKKTQMHIDTAASGREMLQMARVNPYDVIFLDHRMPGMDGVEAFHALRAVSGGANETTPVIALTANAVLGARQMYIDEGFSDYMSKPIDTMRLEQLLIEYLPAEKVTREIVTEEANITPEEETMQENDPFAAIPMIDKEAAITNCGSEETFSEALKVFYDTIEKKADDIERFANESDYRNYTVLVHALKSSARLIGALKLSADALHLEEAGNKEDADEIAKKTPQLLTDYRALKEALAPLYGAPDDTELPLIDGETLSGLYEKIRTYCDEFDLDGLDEVMEEASHYRIPESEEERFTKIKEGITNADWGALEELL